MLRGRFAWMAALTSLVISGCVNSTTPITNRPQYLLHGDQLRHQSRAHLAEAIRQHPSAMDPSFERDVREVAENLIRYTGLYFAEVGKSSVFDQYNWSVHVLESPEVNACVLPDGSIIVYTGLKQLAQDKDELAAVIGHEMAHALCQHTAERLGEQHKAQMTGAVIDAWAASQSSNASQAIAISQLGDLMLQFGMTLPHSRRNEQEADHLGMILMALAGYPPQAAVRIWERALASDGPSGSAFFDTHPSDHDRVRFNAAMLPTVEPIHKRAKELGR